MHTSPRTRRAASTTVQIPLPERPSTAAELAALASTLKFLAGARR